MLTILGANSVLSDVISNSLRFNDGDNAYLTKASIGATTGAGKTFTFSAWIKRSILGIEQYIIHARSADNQGNFARLEFTSGDVLRFRGYSTTYLATSKAFRDVSAWYHIVLAVDTDTSGDGNSVRLYINGDEETSFSVDTNPSTDDDLILGSDRAHYLGQSFYGASAGSPFDGYMADVHLIDGQQLTPSSFGETDTNGVWIPKKYDSTFGGNGFKFEFKQTGTSADASGIGADTSGNASHFTPTNFTALDVTTDTPANNFATMNSLLNSAANFVAFSEGGTYINGAAGTAALTASTIAPNTGKWYVECKMISDNNQQWRCGVRRVTYSDSTADEGILIDRAGYIYSQGTEGASTLTDFSGAPLTQNQIIGIAVDLDSGTKTVSFFEDGSAQGSANTLDIDEEYVFFCHDYATSGNNTPVYSWNFGQPNFSISSGNADANGYGNFEHAPPSGYFALCTKNLAEYG